MVGPDNWKLLISSYLKTDVECLMCVGPVLSMLHFVVLLFNLYLKNKVICQKTVNCLLFLGDNSTNLFSFALIGDVLNFPLHPILK